MNFIGYGYLSVTLSGGLKSSNDLLRIQIRNKPVIHKKVRASARIVLRAGYAGLFCLLPLLPKPILSTALSPDSKYPQAVLESRCLQRRFLVLVKGDKMLRQVIIYPGEDGYWVAECPSLPGCVSQGMTKEEAIANIKEAIEGYILVLEEDGLPVPEEHFETLLVAV